MVSQRSRIDRLFPLLVVADLVGLVLFAVLAVRSIEQGHMITRNRVETLHAVCRAVDRVIDYDRRHETATLEQVEGEERTLTEAVEGNLHLTPAEREFARLYLETVLVIEQTTPKALNANPYRLRDLDCARLVHRARAASSQHTSHVYQTPYGSSAHPPGWGYPPGCPSGHDCVSLPPPAAKLGTSKRMFDSVELSAFPAHPFASAGYTSGYWPTFLSIRARWPQSHTVSIAINAGERARCLDVEPGDATPSEAPGWVRAEKALGAARPCVYSSYWEFVSEVRPALTKAGVKRANAYEWDADYLSCPRLDRGFDATQCTDHALGRNLDESVVTERFLRIAQPPYRPHAKQIRALKSRRALNQRRERRQKCGRTVKPTKVHKARCSIERQRVTNFTKQIRQLERS